MDLKTTEKLDNRYYLVIGLTCKDQEILLESYNLWL